MAPADDVDEQALLTAARTSAAAFAEFYRHFERPMLRFFLRAVQRPELAADLTAETFACALESVSSYDPARGRADQWLFGIARNVLGKSYRHGRVDAAARARLGLPRLVLDDGLEEAIVRLSTDRTDVTAALAQLPQTQREAVEARVVRELDYVDIALELSCSEAVVRQRVSRGLRALRSRLDGER